MTDSQLTLHPLRGPRISVRFRRPLGRHLVQAGKITNTQLVRALDQQKSVAATLGEILVSNGAVAPRDIRTAVAQQCGQYEVDLEAGPPDPALAQLARRAVVEEGGVDHTRRDHGAAAAPLSHLGGEVEGKAMHEPL